MAGKTVAIDRFAALFASVQTGMGREGSLTKLSVEFHRQYPTWPSPCISTYLKYHCMDWVWRDTTLHRCALLPLPIGIFTDTGVKLSMKKFNSITRSLAAMALLSAVMVGCSSTADQESTGEYIDDSMVTTKVKSAILDEPNLKSADISVETFKGVVQLSGFVDDQASISRAGSLARGVEGVTSVKNDLRLK